MDLWEIENSLFDDGYNIVAGVDEAGRGPLAGPVCAAAVILPKNLQIEGLNDSKKLSPKKRDKLYDIIIENAVSYGIGFASVEEIDRYNILNATYMAMNRALEKLSVTPDISIIDGNRSEGVTFKNICVVGGDGKSASVAAASILAKVTRDRLMEELDRQYPQYQFSKHKGYGTKLHYEKIREFGVSPIHRKTFLKKMH
jgi:ribonuclease HII